MDDAIADDAIRPSTKETRKAVFLLIAFALAVRLAVLAGVYVAAKGKEVNDDYQLYEALMARPFALITGKGIEHVGDAGVYAPLIPLQLWVPGGLFSKFTGPVLGRRLGLLVYDLAALAVALRVAFAVAGAPRTRPQWCAAALLCVLPASVGASVVWGQEDTIPALWSAAALACFVWASPVAAMCAAGAGLFTSKLFFAVLMLGIWLATPPGKPRRRATMMGAAWVAAFSTFLLVRWYFSGYVFPDYHYHAMYNSPSVWALYNILINDYPYDYAIRPYIKVLVVLAMLAFVALAWRRPRMPVWSAAVAAHCVFFASFIGIHAEHYQWVLPFLIVFAWARLIDGRLLAFLASVGVTFLAYGYKVVYGLRGPPGIATGGKQAIRDWFERNMGFDLKWVQVAFAVATLATLLWLAREAMRTRADQPRAAA